MYKRFQQDSKRMRLELLRYDQKLKDDKQGMLLMEARAWKQVGWGIRIRGV